VVAVDYCTNTLQTGVCSSFANFTYFIESMQSTLFEKTAINVQQGIKLLIHILKGFEVLYGRFGYFRPTPRMIYFNKMD